MSTDSVTVRGILLPINEPSEGHPERAGEPFCRLSAGFLQLSGLEESNVSLARELSESTQRPLGQPSLFASPREAFCQGLHGAYESTLEYESTQEESHALSVAGVKSPGMTLLERMLDVMKARKWSAREWARVGATRWAQRRVAREPDPSNASR